MTSFTARFAGLATLALAALPMAALSTAAHATSVRVSDLDLASARGAVVFEQRVADAADRFCQGERSLSQRAACIEGVRVEVVEKLAQRQTAIPVQMASRR